MQSTNQYANISKQKMIDNNHLTNWNIDETSQMEIIKDISIFTGPLNGVSQPQLDFDMDLTEFCQNLKEEDFNFDCTDNKGENCSNAYVNSNPLLVQSIHNYYQVIAIGDIDKKRKTKKLQLVLQTNEECHVIRQSDRVTVKLVGLWYDTIIEVNDKVFLSINSLYYNQNEKCYTIHDSYDNVSLSMASSSLNNSIKTIENYIIIYPELLLSPSLIKSAFPCLRKAFFNEEFKLVLGTELKLSNLIGTIIHSLFETMFSKLSSMTNPSNLTPTQFEDELKSIMQKHLLDIALLNLSYEKVYSECKSYSTKVMKFFQDFYFSQMCISGLKLNQYIASEKLYQSQVLGMKGVIDILIQTTNEQNIKEITPFELKTGHFQSNSDVMQVLIYCLILSEQFNSSSSNGLLYYLKNENSFRVKVTLNDIINVIVTRNNIAQYIYKYENNSNSDHTIKDLPPLLNCNECETCYRRVMCKSHYALYEKESSNNDLINKTNEVKEYFNYFYNIINNEQAATNYQIMMQYKQMHFNDNDLNEFTKYSIIRVIDNSHSFNIDIEVLRDEMKSNSMDEDDDNQQGLNSQYIDIRDNYVIYDPESKKAFKGIVINKDNKGRLMLNVLKYHLNQSLSNYFLILQREQGKGMPLNATLLMKTSDSLSKFSYKLMRGNLLLFCSIDSNSIINRLRRLIINLDEPQFSIEKKDKEWVINYIRSKFYTKYLLLNSKQKAALLKGLLCKDYSLIIGFPGSGKTTVIALLIDILASMNKKILVTAHTNIAVDNILLKLLQEKSTTTFCRIGSNLDVIHKNIHPYVVSDSKFNSVIEWKTFFSTQHVYATTSLGITNKIFSNITFDYCIVDEACQEFEPSLIGPLLLSEKFILVGDPFQLRALLKASNPSTPTSLFERLMNAHPTIAEQLELQYRMNESILKLSNECVYENVMQCANDTISKRVIPLMMNRMNTRSNTIIPQWVRDIIDPQRSVLLVDYSSYHDKDYFTKVIDSNDIEVKIIYELVKGLVLCDFDMNEIAILTPYKKQETLLRDTLTILNADNVLTIDKSQGIEKEIVIISFVKTNTKTKLLKDIARINVAFTRPKSKLIIIGLKDILIEIDRLSSYINLLIKSKWIYEMNKDSLASIMKINI